MASIFLDESGDLGFDFAKRGTSKFFLVTFLFVPGSVRPIEKLVQKTHAGLQRKHGRRIGVLHAVKENAITRKRILKGLAEKECSIMTIYLNKQKVYTRLQDEKQVLYNYVTNILLDRVFSKKFVPITQPIDLIASRRETNKFLNENFTQYLDSQVTTNHKGVIRVLIKPPQEEKCLQAVDFASWAIFRKYERSDDSYYNVMKAKIVEESPLFP